MEKTKCCSGVHYSQIIMNDEMENLPMLFGTSDNFLLNHYLKF